MGVWVSGVVFDESGAAFWVQVEWCRGWSFGVTGGCYMFGGEGLGSRG